MNPADASRGEVWDINFDPQIGDEIAKVRPAVVLDVGSARLELRIVVPITGWRPEFAGNVSKVRLDPSPESGLTKASAADAYQIKSLSSRRFVRKRGQLANATVDDIATAVAVLIDAPF
jgi:mRNA interferase MazF